MDSTERPAMCHVSTQEVIEEAEDEGTPIAPAPCTSDGDLEGIEELPWHHAQLALLYGRQVADDIVHPKMERKQVKVNLKLGPKEGHSGAAQLWSNIRNHSNRKLLREDQKIPDTLKNSYGAFVRQLVLQKGDVPVKRNFYEKEDVPDMEHLLDKKKLMQTLDIRHKIELMERSSKINQDKTDILLYNNPVPDLVNASGEEGIDRYLSDRLEDDEESIASYRKWIEEDGGFGKKIKPSESLLELMPPKATKHPGHPKVKFLTEKEAGAERGAFSNKYKVKKDAEHSVVNPQTNRVDLGMEAVELKPFRGDNVSSATGPRNSSSNMKRDLIWQPLTLNALVDYSAKKDTIGSGMFRHGSMKMYSLHNTE